MGRAGAGDPGRDHQPYSARIALKGKEVLRNDKGIITQIQRLTTHDGPGIRSTIFVKGCPLRCRWCSNPETQKQSPQLYFIPRKCRRCGECVRVCPEGAASMDIDHKIDRLKCTRCMLCVEACVNEALEKVGREVTVEEVVAKVKEDYPFYVRSGGGVTISGGEPLSQPGFVSQVFRACHESNISTTLDTCGYGATDEVERVLEDTDLVLLDLKHMSSAAHEKWTGVSNDLILRNATLMARRCAVRISLPLVSGVNDSTENVRQTIEFAISAGIEHIDVLPFHELGTNKYEFLGLKPPFADFDRVSDERLAGVVALIESYGLKSAVGRSF